MDKEYIEKHCLWVVAENIAAHLTERMPADVCSGVRACLYDDTVSALTVQPTQRAAVELTAQQLRYLRSHDVAGFLERLLEATVTSRSHTPVSFMLDYLQQTYDDDTMCRS